MYVIGVGNWRASEPEDGVDVWTSLGVLFPLDNASALNIGGVPTVQADRITELETDLWVYRDGDLIFRGRVSEGTDTLTEDGGEASFVASDYRGLLARRICRNDLTYTQVPQAQLAWNLVAHTQQGAGNLGITQGISPPGRERDRFYDAGQSLGEALDNLSNVIDGFDYVVTPELVFDVFYPRRGRVLEDPFDLGGTLARVERNRNSQWFANGVRVSGGQGTAGVYQQAPTAGIDPAGLWDAQIGYPSVTLQDTITERVAFHLAERGTFRPSYRCLMAPGRWKGNVWPGDSSRLVVRAGRVRDDLAVRVTEVLLNVGPDDSEDVSLSLVGDTEALL